MIYKVLRNLTIPEGHFKEGTKIESQFFKPGQVAQWERDGVIQLVGPSPEEPLLDDEPPVPEPAHLDDLDDADDSFPPTEEPKVSQVKKPKTSMGRGKGRR